MAAENTTIDSKDETTGTNVPKPFVPGTVKASSGVMLAERFAGQKVSGVRMVSRTELTLLSTRQSGRSTRPHS